MEICDDNNYSDSVCYICLDNLRNCDTITDSITIKTSLLCGCPNNYHSSCLQQWVEKTRKCPICKTDILHLYKSTLEYKNYEDIEEILDNLSNIPENSPNLSRNFDITDAVVYTDITYNEDVNYNGIVDELLYRRIFDTDDYMTASFQNINGNIVARLNGVPFQMRANLDYNDMFTNNYLDNFLIGQQKSIIWTYIIILIWIYLWVMILLIITPF